MLKNALKPRKVFIILGAFLMFGFINIAQASELEVTEYNSNGSELQPAEDLNIGIQPAEDVIYGERLRTDSAVSVGRASYFYQGFHTNGVIFANNTIVNNTPDPNRDIGTPVTFGDDVRIDGEIWRGPSRGTSDQMPLKVSDTIIPTMTNINDLGDADHYWRHGYFSGNVAIGNLVGNNVVSEDNLNITNNPQADYVLAYSGNNQFKWVAAGSSAISGSANQTMRYGSNGWEASGVITNDGTDIDIGGGFGDSGVTIYGSGGINADGSLSAGSLTTGGMLTVGGIAGISGQTLISGNLDVGGGYSGGSGFTATSAGNLSANGSLIIDDNSYLNETWIGGGYSGGNGTTLYGTGAIYSTGTINIDGNSYLGGGYSDTDGGVTSYYDGMIISQGDFGSATTLTSSGAATELIWYPRKAAFRAGYVSSDQWDDANIGGYSVGLGYNALASGLFSVAIGDSNTASGVESIAIGGGNTTSGEHAITLGTNSSAAGDYSTAFGSNTSATGDYSTVMGNLGKAQADNSFVWAGDFGCGTSSSSCDLDHESVFAIIGGLCVDDEGGTDCGDVGDGNIEYDGSSSAYDLAEGFPTDEKLDKGDVVIAVDNTKIGYTNKQFDSRVLGVISTSPNLVFNFDGESNDFSSLGGLEYNMPEDSAPLTLSGRIPVKTTNENGNIEVGDLLTTSSREGYAMKFTLRDINEATDFDELKSILKENEERRNSILGKALESCSEVDCTIVTLLSLQ